MHFLNLNFKPVTDLTAEFSSWKTVTYNLPYHVACLAGWREVMTAEHLRHRALFTTVAVSPRETGDENSPRRPSSNTSVCRGIAMNQVIKIESKRYQNDSLSQTLTNIIEINNEVVTSTGKPYYTSWILYIIRNWMDAGWLSLQIIISLSRRRVIR